MTKIKSRNHSESAYYRLALYLPNGSARVQLIEARTDQEAIIKSEQIYSGSGLRLGAQLYKYRFRDTAGPFSFIHKIEEPTVDE